MAGKKKRGGDESEGATATNKQQRDKNPMSSPERSICNIPANRPAAANNEPVCHLCVTQTPNQRHPREERRQITPIGLLTDSREKLGQTGKKAAAALSRIGRHKDYDKRRSQLPFSVPLSLNVTCAGNKRLSIRPELLRRLR